MSDLNDLFKEIAEKLKDKKAVDAAVERSLIEFGTGEGMPEPIKTHKIKRKKPTQPKKGA